jgi:hypothetical protein
VVLLHGDDPHVDAVRAHRLRQHLVELVERNLALHFPAAPRLLGVERREHERDQEQGNERSS